MKRQPAFVLAGQEIAPGTRARIEIPIAPLYIQAEVSLALIVVHGRKPGRLSGVLRAIASGTPRPDPALTNSSKRRTAGRILTAQGCRGTVSHMKTTVDIPDGLLRRAKLAAARRRTTLKVVLEDALRAALDGDGGKSRPIELKTHTFRGQGLQPGMAWRDWETIRALAYDEHGG